MNNLNNSVITGTGRYIPSRRIQNEHFLQNEFYDLQGQKLEKEGREIVDKFLEITTIRERRYVTPDLVTSDIAALAAEDALRSSGTDRETLDYLIVAHNFGDVRSDNQRLDLVPSMAARVKEKLKIDNPSTIAYDLLFGCPGWLQGLIQAHIYIQAGEAKKVLVIGAEVLSRVSDPHDRDSMLYADGAGAVILEAKKTNQKCGILSHIARSDTIRHSKMLYMDRSYKSGNGTRDSIFLKMHGRKLYQYALERVPQAIGECLEKSGTHLKDIKKVLIHQANGKMDEAILKRLYSLYGMKEMPEGIMPMTIERLGNSSVATVPTLLDLILKGDMPGHRIEKGEVIVLASVGAGMNINAAVYAAC